MNLQPVKPDRWGVDIQICCRECGQMFRSVFADLDYVGVYYCKWCADVLREERNHE